MAAFRVIAPGVWVRAGDQVHLLEAGRTLPEGVGADVIERLMSKGMVAEVEAEVEAVEVADVPDVEAMNLDDLRAYAVEHDVDLGGVTRKDDVKAAILAAS